MAKRAIQLTWVDPDTERRTTYNAPRDYPVNPKVKYTGKPEPVNVSEIIKTTFKSVGTLVFGYVILDTARKLLISNFGGK